MASPPPEVSVVMPAYNCLETLAESVRALDAYLRDTAQGHEVIVVVDSPDAALVALARSLESATVRCVTYGANRGKGYAVVQGMRKAAGYYVGYMDEGGDIALEVWARLLAAVRAGAPAAIASKLHPESRVHYPATRRILSRGFRLLTRLLMGVDARDTQTGAKLFARDAVAPILPVIRSTGFSFDVELLGALHERGGGRAAEVPVEIHYNYASTVNARAIPQMLLEVVKIAWRVRVERRYRAREDAGPVKGAS